MHLGLSTFLARHRGVVAWTTHQLVLVIVNKVFLVVMIVNGCFLAFVAVDLDFVGTLWQSVYYAFALRAYFLHEGINVIVSKDLIEKPTLRATTKFAKDFR